MTPNDPSSPERSAASVDILIDCLRSLNITDLGATTVGDDYLSNEVITQTFETLVRDFQRLQKAVGNPEMEEFIAPTWFNLKTKLITSLCLPYKNAVTKMGFVASERQTENTTLASELQTINASHALELQTINASHALELQTINGSHASEISHLQTKNASLASGITLLKQIHAAEIAQLQQANESEIVRLQQINASQSSELSRALARTAADAKEIIGLKTHCDILEKSKEYYNSETLRLYAENSDLKSHRVHDDGVPATATRTQNWTQVMNDPDNQMDAILPLVPNPIIDVEVENLCNTTFAKEPAMYQRVQKCLATHLDSRRTKIHPGSQVFDSHLIEVIGHLKPDMSIVTCSRMSPTVHAMIAAVELKVGNLDKNSFGQLYDYLKGIKAAQPNRRIIIGLLSNLKDNHFLLLDCSQPSLTRCIHYQSVSLAVALTYLRDMVIKDSIYHPPESVFTADLGRLDTHLGNPAFSIVGVFPVPPAISTPEFAEGRWVDPDIVPYGKVQMVVKRTTPGVHGVGIQSRAPRTVKNEIQILLKIREHARAAGITLATMPQILYHNNIFDEFAILPRGTPIHPKDSGIQWVKVVSDVLDALDWLHSYKIVHRDVRMDNIIWNIDHAVLIDFGAAVDLPRHRGAPVGYIGGYLCCPPRIIGNIDISYYPEPADDCFSVVLLVNTVLFPSRWQSFRSEQLEKPGSLETYRLTSFWKQMESSPVWGQYWLAAKHARYDELKKMTQFFVHL